jgi:putative transposase
MPGTHTNLLYHVVFSTKLRVPIIAKPLDKDLYSYIGGIIRGEGGTSIEIGGMPDHVHLLVKLKQTISLADMMRLVKTNSSRWVNQSRKATAKFGWQDGYAAFTVGESQVTRVVEYIRNQAVHHRIVPFQDELRGLLKRHRVDFDEKYLWD